MNQRTVTFGLFILVMIWGTVLLAGSGIVQRPQYANFSLAWVNLAATFATGSWILLAGTGIGLVFARALAPPATLSDLWLLAALTGTGLLGTLWLWLGMVALPPLPMTVILLAGGLFLLVWRRPPMPAAPGLPRLAMVYLGATVLLALARALLPPISFDGLLYHLRLPELWLHFGNVFQPQIQAPFFFPALVEAIFTPALQLGMESASQVIHWGYFLLLMSLTWQITRRFVPSASPPLVLVLVASIQMVPLLAGWAYTDLFFASFQAGVVWTLLRWRESRAGGWLLAAGVLAGLSMGVKYLAAFTPVLAVGMVAMVERRHLVKAIMAVLKFSLAALLVAAPSYLRNFIATGNPLFPFLLPSPYWDAYRATWYAAAGTGIGGSPSAWMALPLTATLALGDASYYDGRPGVLIATFLPLALGLLMLGRGEKPERAALAWLLYFALAYVALWAFGVMNSAGLRQGRFLVTPLVLLCPVIAWGIGQLTALDTPRFAPSRVALLMVASWAAFGLWIGIAETTALDLDTGLFSPSREAWLSERLPSYRALVAEVNTLPETARVRLWYEPRSYGMPPTVEADTLLHEFTWRLQRENGDVARLDALLCREGTDTYRASLAWCRVFAGGVRRQSADSGAI